MNSMIKVNVHMCFYASTFIFKKTFAKNIASKCDMDGFSKDGWSGKEEFYLASLSMVH